MPSQFVLTVIDKPTMVVRALRQQRGNTADIFLPLAHYVIINNYIMNDGYGGFIHIQTERMIGKS